MKKILEAYLKIPYAMPITSGVLVVLSFPPFNFWYLGLVSLIPFYIYVIKEKRFINVFIGGVILGVIFSGYLAYATFLSFHWLPETYLFTTLVKFLFIPITIVASLIVGGVSAALSFLIKKSNLPIERALLILGVAIGEWFIGSLLLGLNFGSFAYVGVHIFLFRIAASIGGMVFVSALVLFLNASLGELILYIMQKNKTKLLSYMTPVIVLVIVLSALAFVPSIRNLDKKTSSSNQKTLSVAVIQDQQRNEKTAFGKLYNGVFSFKSLRQYITDAKKQKPNVIIYPFSPWSGAISNTIDNSSFDRNVITIDYKTFGAWIKPQISPNTTFVIWNTALKNGLYFNELEFWRNGKMIGTYRKRSLFFFLDYTPLWAKKIGVYSTPFDETIGTSTSPVLVSGTKVAGLVCSEVVKPDITKENAKNAEAIFAIGSEAMFSNSLAGEFNLMNAQFRAVETGRPVIRGDRLGPSAIIDKYGSIIKEMQYGESGILFGKIITEKSVGNVPYNHKNDYYFLVVFMLYVVFILFRKQNKQT